LTLGGEGANFKKSEPSLFFGVIERFSALFQERTTGFFSLSAHFLSVDRYRSIAHFDDFQVRSSLNRSKKTSGLL